MLFDDFGPQVVVVLCGRKLRRARFSQYRCYHRHYYQDIKLAINDKWFRSGYASGYSGLFIWHGVVLNVVAAEVVVVEQVW